MNSLVQTQSNLLAMTQALRNDLMAMLTDDDMAYALPGANPTFGELCREMGEIEQSYIDSFKTFTTDFSYRYSDPSIATSIDRLRAWFATLDQDLAAALAALSEDDIQTRTIERPGEHPFPPMIQFHCYREALLIFYAKASVYVRALNKPLSDEWIAWIG